MQNMVYKNNEDKNYSISESISGSAKINNLEISPEDFENYFKSKYKEIKLYNADEIIKLLNSKGKKIVKRTFINHKDSSYFKFFKIGKTVLYNVVEILLYYEFNSNSFDINEYIINKDNLENINVKELSELLSVNESTIRSYVKNKTIPYSFQDNKYYFNYYDVIETISNSQ